MQSYTIISDPGVDDIVALTLLNRLAPAAKNFLISTFGNAPEGLTEKNAREFIALSKSGWGFKRGSGLPINGKVEHPFPDYFHGPDGIWNTHTNENIQTVTQMTTIPPNDYLISLGTFTDVLPLLDHARPTQMMIMGGAFNEKGNETEYAEFNIALDADAAAQFFQHCEGIDIKVVPLDVTRKALWTEEMVRAIPEKDPVVSWMKKILIAWFENYTHEKEKDFNLHDPLSIYLAFFPEHAKWQKSGVSVITEGEKRGKTRFDEKNPPCNVAIDLVNPAEISQTIYEIIIS